jgi:hypothetical protein
MREEAVRRIGAANLFVAMKILGTKALRASARIGHFTAGALLDDTR